MVSNVFPADFFNSLPPDFAGPGYRQASAHTVVEAAPIAEQFAAELCAAGFTSQEVFGMRLAFEEALVNGLRHGNGGDPTKEVRVAYCIRPEEVLVRIEDEGPGFNPHAVADPCAEENLERCCGRGVFLMRHYMTWVQFNERGNSVMMGKRRG